MGKKSKAVKTLLIGGSVLMAYSRVRPKLLVTGASLVEATQPLPGDSFIPSPAYRSTRAVDVKATPAEIFPWLAQLGRNGTGFYGADHLTNAAVPSAAYLRPELSAPYVGEKLDFDEKILELVPDSYIVYGGTDLRSFFGTPMEQTTLILLRPLDAQTTRMIIRVRGYVYGIAAPLLNRLYEVVDYLNGSAQIKNIPARVESLKTLSGNKPTPHHAG
jgi:hypothetical protein